MRCKHIYKALSIACLVLLFLVSCSRQPVYPDPPIEGSAVVIDALALTPEVPVFFTYHHRGKKINFFVVKVDEKILSFLDACARCYPAKKGYRCENGALICRECSVSYSITGIEKGVGS